jgi:patatin-like phospholipase/acyl hydrolase
MSLADRIRSPGPKKILALDGGGIRGLMTVEVLAAIETMLRQELGRGADFVLADYFDFVAGTSTGAVIATCISIGMPVERIRNFYLESGKEMFDRAALLKRFRYKYEDDKLSAKLRSELGGDTTLGSEKLRTLLLVVTRNATTDSPWPVSNNPFAKYNQPDHPDCNLRLPLWQLVRASTAAPTYFPPEVVNIGRRSFVFVDGGVTPYNNPAFLAFVMATVGPYKVVWPAGEDKMLVVSVGTGNAAKANAALDPASMNLLYNASNIPGALMYGALNQQDTLCRVFGRCRYGAHIDNEVGTLMEARGPLEPRLFSYARYDADVSRAGLDALGLAKVDAEHVQLMDSVDYIDEIQQVGRALAKQVVPAHFDRFLR